jgi:predicted RNase H-like HicB family nuclease
LFFGGSDEIENSLLGKKFWIGKLLEHPEIMTQGKTLKELEENMKDAYMLMAFEDVPENHEIKELDLKVCSCRS